jgi:hypothetical protein
MKKQQLVLCLVLLFTLIDVSGFSQTPSQRKRQRDQAIQDSIAAAGGENQNMSASEKRAQKKLMDQNNEVFEDKDPYSKKTQIPDKWKNESGVIMFQKIEYHYYTKMAIAGFDEVFRRRIKLLDKAAVDAYGTFTFQAGQEVGFRIIKKDGTMKPVSTANAIAIESGVPINYTVFGIASRYTYFNVGYKKLAIPDLEPGDILDYYYVYNHEYGRGAGINAVPFPEVIFTLPEEYPIMKQRIEFYVEKEFYINFNSLNGAPNLTQSEQANKHTKVFAVSDSNREREKNEFWEYKYRCEPTVKFQIVYSTESSKDDAPYFLGQPYIPQTKVPQDLIKGVADQIAMEDVKVNGVSTPDKLSDEVITYMRKHHKNLPDSVAYMRYAYYYLRYFLFVQKNREIEDQIADKSESYDAQINYNTYYPYIPSDPTDEISDELFIKTMGLVARDQGIEYDLIFAVPRQIGTLDNLILRNDMLWAMRIKGRKDTYLYPPNKFSNPDEPIYTMEGTDAYYLIPDKQYKKVKMGKFAVPTLPYTNNVTSSTLNVTLNSAMEGSVSVARNCTVKGLSKESFYPEVLIKNQYENQELKKFGGETDMDDINGIHNSTKKAAALKKYNGDLDEQRQKRMDLMKDKAKDDFDIDSYDDFQLVNSGIECDSTQLKFNDKFKVKDLVKKVGPNYTMLVGKLMGATIELKDKDLTRENDVYMAYPRETDNEIDVTIPSGYKVDGIDAFNVNITNSTGGFVSTAKMNGSTLVITTKKYYTANYQPKSSWPDMVKFLQPCYDFSQRKILLKKS